MKEEDRNEMRNLAEAVLRRHLSETRHLQAMDCPRCGHVAPFLKDTQKYLKTLPLSTMGYGIDTLEHTCNIFTCLACGTAFRREQRQVSELTELPDPKSED